MVSAVKKPGLSGMFYTPFSVHKTPVGRPQDSRWSQVLTGEAIIISTKLMRRQPVMEGDFLFDFAKLNV